VSSADSRTYADLTTPAGLKSLATVVDGIRPDMSQIIPPKADGSLGTPTTLVADAHDAGLVVHPYTFRTENTFLPTELQVGTNPSDYGKAVDEQVTFLKTGIDGLFTDQADIGVLSRTKCLDSLVGAGH